MKYRIVADSSCNILTCKEENFYAVPMKIVASREYIDDETLDLDAMLEDLRTFKSKSGSSCPNVGEWLEAFGDAEEIFCVTITKNLSGSYNSCLQAAETYMEEHPGRKVFIFDSLTAGAELMLIVEKIRQCEADGCDFETTKASVLDYHNHCHTVFCLESLTNLARNGRVNPAVAKIAGVLGIRMVGTAQGGTIVPVQKPRGAKKAVQAMVNTMEARGFYDGALVRVSHCRAEEQVAAFREAILSKFPNTRFIIEPTTALCSFYAEVGGYIVGYEGGFNEENDNTKF